MNAAQGAFNQILSSFIMASNTVRQTRAQEQIAKNTAEYREKRLAQADKKTELEEQRIAQAGKKLDMQAAELASKQAYRDSLTKYYNAKASETNARQAVDKASENAFGAYSNRLSERMNEKESKQNIINAMTGTDVANALKSKYNITDKELKG